MLISDVDVRHIIGIRWCMIGTERIGSPWVNISMGCIRTWNMHYLSICQYWWAFYVFIRKPKEGGKAVSWARECARRTWGRRWTHRWRAPMRNPPRDFQGPAWSSPCDSSWCVDSDECWRSARYPRFPISAPPCGWSPWERNWSRRKTPPCPIIRASH